MTYPSPPRRHPADHLARWGREPLALLADGARAGNPFRLHLGLPTVVGFGPDWNRLVLRDLETFTSSRALPRLVPHLSGGVVTADEPGHGERRARLDPHFRGVETMSAAVREIGARAAPTGTFDASAWAARTVLAMLNAVLFSSTFPAPLLARYVAPLERPLPAPMIPRPTGKIRRAIAAELDRRRSEGGADVAAGLVDVPTAVEDLRIALAAGFDTTAHTLAWAAWHLASHPGWRTEDGLDAVIDETLRLYPPGFIGSRRAERDVPFAGGTVPAGALVLYSPLLTHRDPDTWPDPDCFRPERFAGRIRPWTYIPFAAGRRTCLGLHAARLMLRAALEPLVDGTLTAVAGDPTPRAGVTLVARGPLILDRKDN